MTKDICGVIEYGCRIDWSDRDFLGVAYKIPAAINFIDVIVASGHQVASLLTS